MQSFQCCVFDDNSNFDNLSRQCQDCCVTSGDELLPTIADFDGPASRCGRKIQPPKALIYSDEQVHCTFSMYTRSVLPSLNVRHSGRALLLIFSGTYVPTLQLEFSP